MQIEISIILYYILYYILYIIKYYYIGIINLIKVFLAIVSILYVLETDTATLKMRVDR